MAAAPGALAASPDASVGGAAPVSGPVPGLEAVFTATGLSGHIEAANKWCEQMGARFLEEFGEEEVRDLLVQELQLKPLEERRLRKALIATAEAAGRAAAEAAPASVASPKVTCSVASSAMATAASAMAAATSTGGAASAARLPSGGASVFVKNTFLDLDDGSRKSVLRRLNTEPAPELAGVVEDENENDDEDAEEVDDSPDTTAEGLYKTMTCDGYEPSDLWAWAGGDTSAPGTSGGGYASFYAGGSGPSGGYAAASGGAPASAATAEYEYIPPPVVGVVMVPAEIMPTYGIPAVPGPCFPGCVAVPMERFTRWPGGNAAAEDDAVVIDDTPAAPPERDPSKKNVLQRAFSVSSSIYRVRWTVDSRKLKSKDTEAVSPPFELAFDKPADFKLLLRPRITSDAKGGACFKAARGRGTVELRCLDSVDPSSNPTVTFRVSIGSPADPAKQQPPRGPVLHDFAQRSICGLPKGQDEWNFGQVVDKVSQTFVVCLEVLAGTTAGT
eukprot:TRINITY_DN20921_c0_g1_i1.p2 TRINITY_DN20921_c0_g1~~TRINITY_DN20921_c0_g1_i1.p2  ORF type:complete len:521 (-),score=110.81 TRINITY_DN20921_c0_g1_i1:2027-3532(-)